MGYLGLLITHLRQTEVVDRSSGTKALIPPSAHSSRHHAGSLRYAVRIGLLGFQLGGAS